MLPTVIRITAKTKERSHPGEELVYVLSGSVIVSVSGKEYELSEGDSMEFWGSESHWYAPGQGGEGTILSLRVNP